MKLSTVLAGASLFASAALADVDPIIIKVREQIGLLIRPVPPNANEITVGLQILLQ